LFVKPLRELVSNTTNVGKDGGFVPFKTVVESLKAISAEYNKSGVNFGKF